jgi:hypothetical protein
LSENFTLNLTQLELKKLKELEEEITIIDKQAKPFLRWAGGKKWLLKQLESMVDIDAYNNYHEPFIGGGSVFFKFSPKTSFISDSNEWLIETYKSIKEDPQAIIEYLNKFKKDKDHYYKIRKINYTNPFKRSAQFIYLNQMSFNGIFRVNLNGITTLILIISFLLVQLYKIQKLLIQIFQKQLIMLKKEI